MGLLPGNEREACLASELQGGETDAAGLEDVYGTCSEKITSVADTAHGHGSKRICHDNASIRCWYEMGGDVL